MAIKQQFSLHQLSYTSDIPSDLDMVTQYDEYHNQRVLCERDWPVQRKFNATKKAFNPLKMYPPIDRPPTNYGLAKLKEVVTLKDWKLFAERFKTADASYQFFASVCAV